MLPGSSRTGALEQPRRKLDEARRDGKKESDSHRQPTSRTTCWRILSVVESCRRLKVPLREYLANILPGLANASVQSVARLTPAVWAAKTQA